MLLHEQIRIREINDVILDIYGDKLAEKRIRDFSKEVYISAFLERESLTDLAEVAREFEEELGIENTRAYELIEGVAMLLDTGEATAKQLYKTLLDIDSITVLTVLWNLNREWLTEEELSRVKQAAAAFDKHILKTVMPSFPLPGN